MNASLTKPVHEQDSGTPDGGLTLDNIPAVSVESLLAALSQALDLAEGRTKGHASRVCYVASSLAREMELPRLQRSAVFFAALLHDIGVPHASESVATLPRTYEHSLFAASPLSSPRVLANRLGRNQDTIIEAFNEHAFEGAAAAAALGLPPQVAEAILCHHERFDGEGFPLGLSGSEVPLLGRIVAIADFAESVLAGDTNPLLSRRRLEMEIKRESGNAFHPEVADALVRLARQDDFWLGFHDRDAASLLAEFVDTDARLLSPAVTLRVASAFADIADAKNSYKKGHSRRAAEFARMLAGAAGLAEGHAQAVELAALLQDIGMLRVPSRVIGKPEILSVEEMLLLHEHPLESADIVRSVPGWSPIAGWLAGHHERLDGRGYPEGCAAKDIPFEARILAIADIYEALTAARPHRPAMSYAQALHVMRDMAGQNIDPDLLGFFESAVAAKG